MVAIPNSRPRLHQTQLAGTCDRFSAPLDLQLAKDFLIVSFHRFQGEEQPLAHLLIGESLRHEVEDFYLASAEWLDQGLGRGRIRVVFALLLLSFTCSQQLPEIIRHDPTSCCLGQQVRHREAFIDKGTDEAARRGKRERVNEQVERLVLFAMRLERNRLQHQHLEPFILPPPGLHLLAPGREHCQCCGGVSLGQVDPGLAEREVVRLRQVSGRR